MMMAVAKTTEQFERKEDRHQMVTNGTVLHSQSGQHSIGSVCMSLSGPSFSLEDAIDALRSARALSSSSASMPIVVVGHRQHHSLSHSLSIVSKLITIARGVSLLRVSMCARCDHPGLFEASHGMAHLQNAHIKQSSEHYSMDSIFRS